MGSIKISQVNDLSITNNVYGFVYSKVGLRDTAKVLRDFLGLSEKQAYIYKSQFDGNETLKIRTEAYEFETQSLKEGDIGTMNITELQKSLAEVLANKTKI